MFSVLRLISKSRITWKTWTSTFAKCNSGKLKIENFKIMVRCTKNSLKRNVISQSIIYNKYVINFDNFFYDKNIILTWFGLFFYLLHFLLYICDVSLGVIFPCFFLKVSYGFFFCLIDRNTYKKSLETNHVKYFWDGFFTFQDSTFFF